MKLTHKIIKVMNDSRNPMSKLEVFADCRSTHEDENFFHITFRQMVNEGLIERSSKTGYFKLPDTNKDENQISLF